MPNQNSADQRDWKKIIGVVLFVTLLLSVVYAVVKIVISPPGPAHVEGFRQVKSDYVLMLIQCLLGLAVMMIPSLVERKFSIDIPNKMEILFFIFLFGAIYLGEIRNFYYRIPYWDTILHAFGGAMLGALGFILVSYLNESEQVQIALSPGFVALFAFSFALSAGCLWEIYEYVSDGLLSLNMQKYALADGTLLVGRAALADTMKDLIVDALSALVISAIGFFLLKKNKLRTI